jgi:hypothetical protein
MTKNYFDLLNEVNVNGKTEKKNGLTYLSWAWAWGEVKKRFPDAQYTIYENKDGWNYHTDGRTCWVKTGVTIDGLEHIEYLPVMDYRNNSIPADKVTSFDVNKAIQRSLTKACARHGLGLYIYAGEDLPEEVTEETQKEEAQPKPKKVAKKSAEKPAEEKPAPVEIDRETYFKFVRAYAEGKTTKSGGDLRERWIQMAHPTPEMLAEFDNNVAEYRAALNGQEL